MTTEKDLKVFSCISDFLLDLDSVFDKCKSINLFNKLIEKTTFRDIQAIHRYINAFDSFYSRNPNFIKDKTLSDSPRIVYNDRIYIDVNWVMNKAGSDRSTIYSHLVTIYTILNSDKLTKKQASKTLEKLKDNENDISKNLNIPDTREGDFLKESLAGIKDLTKEFDLESSENPAEMIGKVMQSEFFQNFSESMKSKFDNGEIDVQSLLKTVTGVVQDSGMSDDISGLMGNLDLGNLSQMMGVMQESNTNVPRLENIE